MSEALQPWPEFRLVAVSGSHLPDEWNKRYPILEVPAREAIPFVQPVDLRILSWEDGVFIQFGELGSQSFCVDPVTGRVVTLLMGQDGSVIRGPLMVNSSLPQYVETARQATLGFPYDDGRNDPDADPDDDPDFTTVADDLKNALSKIDAVAWAGDGFWDDFYWDVAGGALWSIDFQPPHR